VPFGDTYCYGATDRARSRDRRFLEIHQTYKKQRLCSNDRSVREDLARTKILTAIRDHLLSPEGIAHTRKRVAEELRDYSNKLSAELRDRRERLARTEEKMRGRVDFIATGDRSEYVVSTLHDLESFTRQEREALADLERASHEPLRLPCIEEVCARVADLDAWLAQDPEAGREQLRRWLKDGAIRIGPTQGRARSWPRAKSCR
jgi:hypothetical protein